jgi:hypothetical protein
VLGEMLTAELQQLLPSSFRGHPPGAEVHDEASIAVIDDSSIAILIAESDGLARIRRAAERPQVEATNGLRAMGPLAQIIRVGLGCPARERLILPRYAPI